MTAHESIDDAARRLFAQKYPDRNYDDIRDITKINWMRSAWDERASAHADLAAVVVETDPIRILKDALFRLEKLGAQPCNYGGVLTTDDQFAWIEYSLRPQGYRPGGTRDGAELDWFRAEVEEKLKVATRAEHADALFPMGPEEAAFYHRTRADLLGWVLDMLPSDAPGLIPHHASEGDDEAKTDAWNDFEGDHLTDGNGYATAEVYRLCREAFDAAWPQGRTVAIEAALSAFRAKHEAPDGGEVSVDDLAQEIRRVAGHRILDARALAEALMPYLRVRSSAPEAREGEASGPNSFSAEGRFFLTVDHLTRMTWRWGESCGIDDVSWDQTGDSYNETCRADHQKARRAVVNAFHAAVAEKIAASAPSDDKLRIAVEALEGARQIAGRLDSHDAGMMEDEIQAIDQALVALKTCAEEPS